MRVSDLIALHGVQKWGSVPLMDPLTVSDEMYELGLVALCSGWIGREGKRRRCGLESAKVGANCKAHGGDQLAAQRMVQKQRQIIEDSLLPMATARVLEILADPEAKDVDVIRIWSTIMDRVGLAAMQNISLQADVQVTAPLDILRAMLSNPVQQAIEDGSVVDGEIVEG